MRLPYRQAIAPALAFLVAALLAPGDAYAQGTRGTTGQSRRGTLQQNYQAGGGQQRLPFSAGGNARGGQQQGGFGQTRGGMAAGGMGAGGLGGEVAAEGSVNQGPMSAGLAQGVNDRFQEGGFVGRDANDVRMGFESQSGRRGQGGMMDMMIENLNEMRDSRRRWREQNSAPPPIRVRLQPAFDLPMVPAAQANAVTEARVTRVIARSGIGIGSTQIQVAGGTATLRGVVPTARDRALVERIASLEPGVSRVENLVTIQAPPSPPAP
jgi:hypothetical protein